MSEQPVAEFDVAEARRILAGVFAPWVQDLGLSIEGLETIAPPGAAADWQPGAILRMKFSERLCRSGGWSLAVPKTRFVTFTVVETVALPPAATSPFEAI